MPSRENLAPYKNDSTWDIVIGGYHGSTTDFVLYFKLIFIQTLLTLV